MHKLWHGPTSALRHFFEQSPIKVFAADPYPWMWQVAAAGTPAVVVLQSSFVSGVTSGSNSLKLPITATKTPPPPITAKTMAKTIGDRQNHGTGHSFLFYREQARILLQRPEDAAVTSLLPSNSNETEQTLHNTYLKNAETDALAALLTLQSGWPSEELQKIADTLSIQAFDEAAKTSVWIKGRSYARCATEDTSGLLDIILGQVTQDAALLQQSVQELIAKAGVICSNAALSLVAFTDKARTLSEARFDTEYLPASERFAYALQEGDLCISDPWVQRLATAQERKQGRRILPDLLLFEAVETPVITTEDNIRTFPEPSDLPRQKRSGA